MADSNVAAQECDASGVHEALFEKYPARETNLGSLKVLRALPIRQRRLIGPWCFLDRFGPLSFTGAKPMDVAPHPHMGLQTVTWLLEGEILHTDSLGSEQVLGPGAVNVMTSGAGIAHAEETPSKNSGLLNGVQLWVALPDAQRNGQAFFQHIAEVPAVERAGGAISVFAGSLAGQLSAAKHFSPLLAVELLTRPGASLDLPLDPSFEHAILLLTGDGEVEGQPIDASSLCYLGVNRSSLELKSKGGCRALLIGGPPFPEKILMWWNFVARAPEEIAQARADWQSRERFGDVRAYRGPRLNAPALMRFAPPNPVS